MATTKPSASADQAGGKTATYTVISPLEHGVLVKGQSVVTRYEPGETVELTEAEAAPLLGHTVKAEKA